MFLGLRNPQLWAHLRTPAGFTPTDLIRRCGQACTLRRSEFSSSTRVNQVHARARLRCTLSTPRLAAQPLPRSLPKTPFPLFPPAAQAALPLLRPKALMLDACGTFLIPSEPVTDVYQRYASRYGIERPAHLILRDFRRAYNAPPDPTIGTLRYCGDGRDFWRRVVFQSLATENEALFQDVYNYFSEPEAWTVPPGFADAMVRIRALGIKLAVVSNFDGRLRDILNVLHLQHLFDAVIVSCEVGAEKPNPAIFDAACRALDVHPPTDFVLHVGDDRRNDVWGARACGITAWLWQSDVTSFDEVADRIVTGYTTI